VRETDQGTRALQGDKPISSAVAKKYLEKAFGEDLSRARSAMDTLANSYKDKDELDAEAYSLYEQFRPNAEWGRRGKLDLEFIEGLSKR